MYRYLRVTVAVVAAAIASGTPTPTAVANTSPAVSLSRQAATSAKADIELAIDTTGSMDDAISQAKTDATAIVSDIQASVPDSDFAVVAFKDSGDGSNEYQVLQGMTASADDVAAAVDPLSAHGGGDSPEAQNLVFHNSYAASPILPSRVAFPVPHAAPGQSTGTRRPAGSRIPHRTAAELAGEIGWRPGSKKIVIVLSDEQPHGDLATQGFDGCDDVEDDPHGLVTSDELDGMSAAGRTLFMVDYGDLLTCDQSLTGATGGKAVEASDSVAADIVALILTTNPPSAAKSELAVEDGQPRFVPADGVAKTTLQLTLSDSAGSPLTLRTFQVGLRAPDGFPNIRAARAYRHVSVSGSLLTDGIGRAFITLRSRLDGSCGAGLPAACAVPGPVLLTITDDLTGTHVRFPLRIEFTRKVVVLAMGMNSKLANRFCYWGPHDGSGCSADSALSDAGTLYGALNGLNYKPVTDYASPPAHATVLDVSWNATTCHAGDSTRQCLAQLAVDRVHQDVDWFAPPYDLSFVPWFLRDVDRQNHIDSYADKLVTTLIAYDQDLASARGIHSSFILIGHSMGGELVVRAIGEALTRKYFTSRPGLLHTVVALDGALNWEGFDPGRSEASKVCLPRALEVLPDGLVAKKDPARERQNAAYVDAGYAFLGTTTVAITMKEDQVIPTGVATLSSPLPAASPGYIPLVYTMGSTRAKTTCAHGTLKRLDGQGSYPRVNGGTTRFPLRDLVLDASRFVGSAVTP